MKRRRYSGSDGAAVGDVGSCLRPLDTRNLAVDWPRWKQRFEIFIAASFGASLDDHRRLALFLNTIGTEGLELANTLCPELLRFPETEITLASVQCRFDSHCETLPNQDVLVVQQLHKVSRGHFQGDGGELHPEKLQRIHEDLRQVLASGQFDSRPGVREDLLRDHLLASIGSDSLRHCLISPGGNTSPETILARYQRLVSEYNVLQKVLPYLCLRDLVSLGHTSAALRAIVEGYAKEGLPVTINRCCTRVASKKEALLLFGRCRELRLVEVPKEVVQLALETFPKVQKLTVHGVVWEKEERDRDVELPRSLKELRLCDITGPESLFIPLIECSPEELEVLVVKRLTITEEDDVGGTEDTVLAKLRYLITDHSQLMLCIRADSLKYLSVCEKENWYFFFQDNVEIVNVEFEFDDDNEVYDIFKHSSIKHLTIKRFPQFHRERHLIEWNMPHLEYLRIKDPGDPLDYEALMKYLKQCPNLKTVDLTSQAIPEEPLILNLNNDCLEHIISFLDVKAGVSFGAIEQRFLDVVRKHWFKNTSLYLCDVDLEQPPWFLMEMGRHVTSLWFGYGSKKDLIRILSTFRKISELELGPGFEHNSGLKAVLRGRLPQSLKILRVRNPSNFRNLDIPNLQIINSYY